MILTIFVHHLGVYEGGGSLGVAFFFVLSGFSLTLGYGEKILVPDFSYKQYLLKRLVKFYPLHWLCLFAAVPIVLIESTWQTSAFVINAALLQTWIPFNEYYFSFNSVSWYLADTVFLAVLFPVLCRFIEQRTIKGRFIVAALLVVAYAIIQYLLYGRDVYAFIYINPIARIPDFIVGILLALSYKDMKTYNEKIIRFVDKCNIGIQILCFLSIVVLVIISTVLTKQQTRMAFYYWPSIILVIGCATLLSKSTKKNILRSAHLVSLGGISFEFYMIHQLVIRYSSFIGESMFVQKNNVWIIAVVSFVITIGISYLVKQRYEKPISSFFKFRCI